MKSDPPTGRSAPLGATIVTGGANFSLYARNATSVELLLFDREDAATSRTIPIDPVQRPLRPDLGQEIRIPPHDLPPLVDVEQPSK